MYNKTTMSKEIGLQSGQIQIPTLSEVDELITIARSGNIRAAKKLFRCYRFCPSPTNPEEVKVINMIYDAFNELFK